MIFSDRLIRAIQEKKSALIVGLDPHVSLMPPRIVRGIDSGDRVEVAQITRAFCLNILDVVADIVPGVKPQVAFFERLGPPGFEVLEEIVEAARSKGLLVISDCKRGDIGSTAAAYAEYHFEDAGGSGAKGLGADAITLSPYLGEDSLAPFAKYVPDGRGLFILAKSSNSGSSDFQDRSIEYEGQIVPLYQAVAQLVQKISDKFPVGEFGYSPVGIVVGATFPEQAGLLRDRFPRLYFLVPGIGAQGAQPDELRGCFNEDGLGAIINASRSILFAYRENEADSEGKYWQDAAREAAVALRDSLNAAIRSG